MQKYLYRYEYFFSAVAKQACRKLTVAHPGCYRRPARPFSSATGKSPVALSAGARRALIVPVASSAPARAGAHLPVAPSAGARRALILPVASSAPARAGAHFTGCTTGSKPDATGESPVAQLKCYRWITGCRSDATGKSPVADPTQPVQ